MNKRINELIKQAREDGDHIYYYSQEFAERFANLIIQECLSCVTCCMETTDYPDDFVKSMVELNAQRVVEKVIKSEFGIK